MEEIKLNYEEMVGSLNPLRKGRVLDSEQMLEELDEPLIKRNKIIIEKNRISCPKCNSSINVIKHGLRWLKNTSYNQKRLCKKCKIFFSTDSAVSKINENNRLYIFYLNECGYSLREISRRLKKINDLDISYTAIMFYLRLNKIKRPNHIIYSKKRRNSEYYTE